MNENKQPTDTFQDNEVEISSKGEELERVNKSESKGSDVVEMQLIKEDFTEVVAVEEKLTVTEETEEQYESGTEINNLGVEQPVRKYKRCLVCQKECKKRIKRCRECRGGLYCSGRCREEHAGAHQEICGHIKELEKIEERKRIASAFSVREKNQVKLKIKNSLVKLVGERPMLTCTVNGKKCTALWDTGAMISMADMEWLDTFSPDCEMMTVEEFLEGDNLHLYAANNTPVDVEGVALVDLGIGSDYEVSVPFLITKNELEDPIIGYNVIKHVAQSDVKELPKLLKETLPCLKAAQVEPLIALLKADPIEEEEVLVDRKTVIPANTRCRVKCRTRFDTAEERQNVLFSPHPLDSELEMTDSVVQIKMGKRKVHVMVTNPSNMPVTLDRGAVLGSIQPVSAMVPIGVDDTVSHDPGHAATVRAHVQSVQVKEMPEIDLSHLSAEQRSVAEKVLEEEKEVFCQGEGDHGDCPDLVMEINLTDNVPVVVPHRNIPRPLYEEVKNFINDLIANGWVQESKSAYSSPIICVRKKDSTLRLCIDYRALNKKMIPDKQPIPRIQEIFDGLGGQEWFTTLDMAKAYHQGYVG